MVGMNDTIYLIDFGLAQYFRHPTTHIHVPLIAGSNLVGTIRYTSINSHLGLQQSRRDDLESFAYTVAYLLHGQLPWQGISSSRNRDRHHAVLRRKREIGRVICDAFPSSITTILLYTRSLDFEAKPDYGHLHSLL
jgi:casein kinase I family protein HRR25